MFVPEIADWSALENCHEEEDSASEDGNGDGGVNNPLVDGFNRYSEKEQPERILVTVFTQLVREQFTQWIFST